MSATITDPAVLRPGQPVTVTLMDTVDRTMTITGTIEHIDSDTAVIRVSAAETLTCPLEMIAGDPR
jgi:ribosome maturation factor RimP